MLRRARKRNVSSTESNKQKNKRKEEKQKIIPLGSKSRDDAEEAALESLVLGGNEQLLNQLIDKSEEEEVKAAKRKKDSERRPAWEDQDDEIGCVGERKKGIKTDIPTKEYTQRLKDQFEKVSSVPNWAQLPTDKVKNSDEEDLSVEDILHRTGDYLIPSASLPKGVLQIKQCTDANKENPLQGKVTALEFHPTAQVLLTGGFNNTLSLFQVDGKINSKIQSVFMENFPLYSAHFTVDGVEVVMGSKHKGFNYYDMIAGKIVKVPKIKGLDENHMKYFEVSPDGRFLVFRGEYGAMHLISAKTKEWIHTLKMNGSVESVSFSHNGSRLFSHGDDGQVYVFDLNTRDCIHTFMDEGCIHGTCVAASPNSQYLACGSSSGVVNLYEMDRCLSSRNPKPLRAIMNLTTSCTEAKFNSTSEILAVTSNEMEKAVKLVHVPSTTVFSNFPESTDSSIRIPTHIDFSLNSGYFTLGTHKGRALLYRIKHYRNY